MRDDINDEKAKELAVKWTSGVNDDGVEVYDMRCQAACYEMAEWKDSQIAMLLKEMNKLRRRLANKSGKKIGMKEIDEFLERSRSHTPACAEYAYKAMSAKSKEALFSIALETPSVEFICESERDGWGLGPDKIASIFAQYINGQYMYDAGYRSVMYCKYEGDVSLQSTVYTFMASKARLYLPKWSVCMIYLVDGSELEVTGEGYAQVYLYGENKIIGEKADLRIFKR